VSQDDDERQPDETLNMDGTWHRVPGRDRCFCFPSDRSCPYCNGYVHFQGIYGGYYCRCEDCGYEE
jgi:hypothetical protein